MLEKTENNFVPKKVLNDLIKLYHEEKFSKILEKKIQLIYKYPNSFNIYNIIGSTNLAIGNYKEAIRNFNAAIIINPTKPNIYYNLGIAYHHFGDMQKAIKKYKKAISLNPNNAEVYCNMGMSLKELGDIQGAIANYQKTLGINPKHTGAFINLGEVFSKKGDNIKALFYLKKAIKLNPNSAKTYSNLAYVFIQLGKIKDAFDLLQKSQLLCKNLDQTFMNLDKIHFLTLNYIYHNHNKSLAKFLGNIDIQNISNFLKNISDDFLSINFQILFKKIYSPELKINFKNNPVKQENIPICFLGFGRSGSLFLHSLLDGHPEISTLPGYFFKGWFNQQNWPVLEPDYANQDWRKILAEKIYDNFEPQFNANSQKNVIGKPNGEVKWLAKELGFTQLGNYRSEILKLDEKKFKTALVKLLMPFEKVNSKICFELIHEAYDKAYRIDKNNIKAKKIFYHLHNPGYFERACFLHHYPNTKTLFIVRNPIQMLESWLLNDINQLIYLSRKIQFYKDGYQFKSILNSSVKIATTLEYFLDPLNSVGEVRGVKLEDLKNAPNETLKKLCNWMDIEENPSLLKSEFMGKKFSRPSVNFNNITGFDTRSIDVPLGRVFSSRDIKIIETLYWPFMNMYGYTKISEKKFLENVREIRPYLDEPFQFEIDIYNKLPKDKPEIDKITQFNNIHKYLIKIWDILNENKTYPNLIKPIIIIKADTLKQI